MKPLQLSDFTVDPKNKNIHYATFSNEGFIIEVELVHENWDFNKVFELCTSVFENFDQLDNKAKSFLTTIQVKIINEQEELKKNNLVYVVATNQLIRVARPERTIFTAYAALKGHNSYSGFTHYRNDRPL